MIVDGLHVDDGGAGPAVVLHAGLGCDAGVWGAQIESLRRTHRVVAFDARGHGRSARAQRYSIEGLASDLDRIVTAVGIDRFRLVGHSMSGGVISAYAATHADKLEGLVYVDAVGDLSQGPEELKRWFLSQRPQTPDEMRAAFDAMLGPHAKPTTRAYVLDAAAATDPRAFVDLRADLAGHSWAAAARRFAGPKVAIETGDPNPYLASALGIERRVIAGAVSHWFMLDAPEETLALLEAALR